MYVSKNKKDNENHKGNWETYLSSSFKCLIFLLTHHPHLWKFIRLFSFFTAIVGWIHLILSRVIKVSSRCCVTGASVPTPIHKYNNSRFKNDALEITEKNSVFVTLTICLFNSSHVVSKINCGFVDEIFKVLSRCALSFLVCCDLIWIFSRVVYELLKMDRSMYGKFVPGTLNPYQCSLKKGTPPGCKFLITLFLFLKYTKVS